MTRAALVVLVLAFAPLASAQDALERVPDPPADPAAEASDGTVSDAELIRWASNEVREHDGRPLTPPRAPVPPDGYVGTGVDGPVVLPHQADRDALRLIAEVGGGAIGVLVGGGAGALLVWGALEAEANPDWMLAAMAAGTMLGAVGVTTGVFLAGDALGGGGNYGHTFIGQLIGAVASLPLVTIGLAEGAPAVAIVSAGILPLAGAVLAYERSSANRGGPAPGGSVTPLQGGALGGVAGVM